MAAAPCRVSCGGWAIKGLSGGSAKSSLTPCDAQQRSCAARALVNEPRKWVWCSIAAAIHGAAVLSPGCLAAPPSPASFPAKRGCEWWSELVTDQLHSMLVANVRGAVQGCRCRLLRVVRRLGTQGAVSQQRQSSLTPCRTLHSSCLGWLVDDSVPRHAVQRPGCHHAFWRQPDVDCPAPAW